MKMPVERRIQEITNRLKNACLEIKTPPEGRGRNMQGAVRDREISSSRADPVKAEVGWAVSSKQERRHQGVRRGVKEKPRVEKEKVYEC